MKRIISLILVLALVLSVLSCAVFAEEAVEEPAPQTALQAANARFEQSVQELANTILSCTRNILSSGGLTAMTGTMLLGAKATQQVAQWGVDYYQKQLDEQKPALDAANQALKEIDDQITVLKLKLAFTYKKADKEALQQQIAALQEKRAPLAEEAEKLQAAYDAVDLKLNGTAVDALVRAFLSGDFKDTADAGLKLIGQLLSGKITSGDIKDAYEQSTGLIKAIAAFAAIGRGEINQENIQAIVNMIRSLRVPVATRKLIIDRITDYLTLAYANAKGSLGTAFQSLIDIPQKLWEATRSFGDLVIAGLIPA